MADQVTPRGWRTGTYAQRPTRFTFELPEGEPARLHLTINEHQMKTLTYDIRFTPAEADGLITLLRQLNGEGQ